MSAADKYFQFPLSTLIGQWNTSAAIVQAIIDCGIWHLFEHIPSELLGDAMQQMAERYADRNELVVGEHYEPDCDHDPFMAVTEYLNVPLGETQIAKAMIKTGKSAARFTTTGTSCRIRTDIARDMMDWPVNKTRVLVAVYAGVGADHYKWLSGPRLQMLAAGYSGKADAEQHGHRGILTADTVRYWVDELWRANLFQMASESRKKTYYSNKFSTDRALAAYLKELKPVPKRKVSF